MPNPPSPPRPPPPSPLPPAPSETATNVATPTVLLGLSLFGNSLNAQLSQGNLTQIMTAVAGAVGTNASLVSVATTDYVISFVLGLVGLNASVSINAASVRSALLTATRASSQGISLQMQGVNAGGARRRLLSVEATTLAYGSNLTAMNALNATLISVVQNGTLVATLQAAGVNATGTVLPVVPLPGVQLHLAFQCPVGALGGNGTLLPNVTSMLQIVSPGGVLDTSATLFANLSAIVGVTSVAITLAPIIGALQPTATCACVLCCFVR